MLNRAIRQTYPPGSTFKIVTAAAALDAEVVTDPDADTDTPSPYVLPGTSTTLPNEARSCEKASLAEAIRVSCNTVMADLGVRVGLKGMVDAVQKFGFNDTGLRIPSGVAKSNFDTEMTDDQLALSSIGQFDTTATPLQMAMVASAVANGGDLMRPYLVDRTTTRGGTTVHQNGSRTYHRAMNPRTAMQLRDMMVDVVENGTGSNAAIDGVTVGGKTGTAQHGIDNSGRPYAWFISWAQAPGSAQCGRRGRGGRRGRRGEPGGHQRRRQRGPDRAFRHGGGAGRLTVPRRARKPSPAPVPAPARAGQPIGLRASDRTLAVSAASCVRSMESGAFTAVSGVITATMAPVFPSPQAHMGKLVVVPFVFCCRTWHSTVMPYPSGVNFLAGTARVAPSASAAPESILRRANSGLFSCPHIPDRTSAPPLEEVYCATTAFGFRMLGS